MSEIPNDNEDLERPSFIRMRAKDTFDGQERVFTPGRRRGLCATGTSSMNELSSYLWTLCRGLHDAKNH